MYVYMYMYVYIDVIIPVCKRGVRGLYTIHCPLLLTVRWGEITLGIPPGVKRPGSRVKHRSYNVTYICIYIHIYNKYSYAIKHINKYSYAIKHIVMYIYTTMLSRI